MPDRVEFWEVGGNCPRDNQPHEPRYSGDDDCPACGQFNARLHPSRANAPAREARVPFASSMVTEAEGHRQQGMNRSNATSITHYNAAGTPSGRSTVPVLQQLYDYSPTNRGLAAANAARSSASNSPGTPRKNGRKLPPPPKIYWYYVELRQATIHVTSTGNRHLNRHPEKTRLLKERVFTFTIDTWPGPSEDILRYFLHQLEWSDQQVRGIPGYSRHFLATYHKETGLPIQKAPPSAGLPIEIQMTSFVPWKNPDVKGFRVDICVEVMDRVSKRRLDEATLPPLEDIVRGRVPVSSSPPPSFHSPSLSPMRSISPTRSDTPSDTTPPSSKAGGVDRASVGAFTPTPRPKRKIIDLTGVGDNAYSHSESDEEENIKSETHVDPDIKEEGARADLELGEDGFLQQNSAPETESPREAAMKAGQAAVRRAEAKQRLGQYGSRSSAGEEPEHRALANQGPISRQSSSLERAPTGANIHKQDASAPAKRPRLGPNWVPVAGMKLESPKKHKGPESASSPKRKRNDKDDGKPSKFKKEKSKKKSKEAREPEPTDRKTRGVGEVGKYRSMLSGIDFRVSKGVARGN